MAIQTDNSRLQKASLEQRLALMNKPAPAFLNPAQVAQLFNLPAGLSFADDFTLTAAVPTYGTSYLQIFSAVVVTTDPSQPNNNWALLDSQFAATALPSVSVNFQPINANVSHLVEFSISISDASVQYTFDVSGPFESTQQVTISQSQIVSTVVPPIVPAIGIFGVSLTQTNPSSENAGWMFHSVKVTALST